MRLAVVYESGIARDNLERMFGHREGIDLRWSASGHEEVRGRLAAEPVDVILMEARRAPEKLRGLRGQQLPAVILVNDAATGDQAEVFDALGLGAIDVVNTGSLYETDPSGFAAEQPLLCDKLLTISKLLGLKIARAPVVPAAPAGPPATYDGLLIAVGSSTGGPAALAELLGGLAPDPKVAFVVIQHMDDVFIGDFVTWLAQQTPLTVRFAEEGNGPEPGVIAVAHTDLHLTLDAGGRFHYTREPSDYAYRPSVDVFFESAERHWRRPLVAVLLTGMGSDGAKGLLKLRRSGHMTIGQDEASSAVYGMPKAAARLDAAVQVLSLQGIARYLRSRVGRGAEQGAADGIA